MPLAHPTSALHVSWQCLKNGLDGDRFAAQFTLHNLSEHALPKAYWALYFNTCRKVVAQTVTGGMCIEHINGDLWRMRPGPDFEGLASGHSVCVAYQGIHWVISNTDAPLGLYIVHHEGTPRERLETIGTPQVLPFASDAARNRKHDDITPQVRTAQERFAQNQGLTLEPTAQICPITPTPARLVLNNGHFLIKATTPIVHTAALTPEAQLLHALLHEHGGIQVPLTTSPQRQGPHIALQLTDAPSAAELKSSEAYTLRITEGSITICASTPAGVFYGVQSLRHLLPVASALNPQAELAVPQCTVEDGPRFAYRGLHLDVARNFSSKASVLRLLDCMALYKLNKFHFHLTDDEGWRLEIPGLPELTQWGSNRAHSAHETEALWPSFASGATRAQNAGSGYYTRQDYIDILRYAHARHIEVIPEIDLPGHARAAIKAMQVRYAHYMAQGLTSQAHAYLLHDPADQSEYESVQLWNDNVVCVANESLYAFIDKVVQELRSMHIEAQAPLITLHTGGDEVPQGCWVGSPACQTLMAAQHMQGPRDLSNYFIKRVHALLQRYGIRFGGWEETALMEAPAGHTSHHAPIPEFVQAGFQVYVWNNIWGWGQEDYAYQLANAGYPTVLCNVTNLYFDLAYAKDPDEPGYYWGGFVETQTVFDFCPTDIFTTASTNLMGHALDNSTLDNKVRLTEQGHKNILGIQGQLWAENITDAERLEYFAMPRLIALGERAWAQDPGWTQVPDPTHRKTRMHQDWNAFANRLGQRELPRLDGLLGGYGYRIPLPGARVVDGVLHANTSAPGMTIRYTIDGSDPTHQSPAYTAPIPVSGTVKLASFTWRNRRSRVVMVNG